MQQKIVEEREVHPHYKVSKSNALIDSVYSLSALEQKVLISAISLLNSKEQENDTIYRLSISSLREVLKGNKGSFYSQIKQLTIDIMSKPFIYYDKNEGRTLQGSWFASCEYIDNEGVVEIEFSIKVKKLLLGLSRDFTSYMLGYAVRLKSKYSIRMYELMKRLENLNRKTLSVEELRMKLGVGNNYPRYSQFKQYVLETTKKEINLYTDIKVLYKESREGGRKVVKLTFTIRKNKKNVEEKPVKSLLYPDEEIGKYLEINSVSFSQIEFIFEKFELDYIKERIERFEYHKKSIPEKIEKQGKGKYLYNLITHTDWKDDKFETYKEELKEKERIKKEREEKKRLNALKKEYEEYITRLIKPFESLEIEEQERIDIQADKKMSRMVSHFTFGTDTIQKMKRDLIDKIIKEEAMKYLPDYDEWIRDR